MTRVAVLGDLHIGKALYGFDLTPRIRQTMVEFFSFCLRTKAAAAVQLGDVFDRSTPTEHHRKIVAAWCNEFERIGMPLYLMPGNHDVIGKLVTPSALEYLKTPPWRYVRVVDRSAMIGGVGVLLPFPSAGIYDRNEAETEAAELLSANPGAPVFAHLNVQGAKLGCQEWIYRGGDHSLTSVRARPAVVGHIHEPQVVRGNVYCVGAAERLQFNEASQPRYFALVDDCRVKLYARPPIIDLRVIEIDASSAANAAPLTAAEVLAGLPPVARQLVKLVVFVDEGSSINLPDLEKGLYSKGAIHVVTAPIVVRKRRKKRRQTRIEDPLIAAKRFLRTKIADQDTRAALFDRFKQLQGRIT